MSNCKIQMGAVLAALVGPWGGWGNTTLFESLRLVFD